jgi:hypothetical protein
MGFQLVAAGTSSSLILFWSPQISLYLTCFSCPIVFLQILEAQPGSGGSTLSAVVRMDTGFFPRTFLRQSLFDPFLLAGLQEERVPFYFLDDVFALYFTFESTQEIFYRFAFL